MNLNEREAWIAVVGLPNEVKIEMRAFFSQLAFHLAKNGRASVALGEMVCVMHFAGAFVVN